MLELYHAPRSRATRVIQLIEEMGVGPEIALHEVAIPRFDGSGGRDPANPHPEGKVPLLLHDGAEIRESNAIMLYLTDHFDSPLGRPVGHPSRGAYLSWLAWYGNVFEPVYVLQIAEARHPAFDATFRDVPTAVARLEEALTGKDYLVDDAFSAADIIVSSTYGWFRDAIPDVPAIRDWVARCLERPKMLAVTREQALPEDHSSSSGS